MKALPNPSAEPHRRAPASPPCASEQGCDSARGGAGCVRGAARFPRTLRLLRHADFQRVYQQGRRHFAAHMTVFYRERTAADRPRPAAAAPAAGPRVGFTVGRLLGGAVERNRIKRRLREAVRASLTTLPLAVDVVINPKKSARTAGFALLKDEVARAFQLIAGKESHRA